MLSPGSLKVNDGEIETELYYVDETESGSMYQYYFTMPNEDVEISLAFELDEGRTANSITNFDIEDAEYGQPLDIKIESIAGADSAIIIYSDSPYGPFTTETPTSLGTWYAYVLIEGTNEYLVLMSDDLIKILQENPEETKKNTIVNISKGSQILINLKKNLTVIVETERGLQFGKVEIPNFDIESEKIKFPLKDVIRISTKKDYAEYKKNISDAKQALNKCRKLIDKYNLNMQVMDATFTFDRNQLLFRFISDGRVDFRDLAKDLANCYKTRIELRQVGVRDKAKEIGGYGLCGQKLCCSRFNCDFSSVSINMAKNQNLSLNPNKINGCCGRLLCCLKYENDTYKECRKDLPDVGKIIERRVEKPIKTTSELVELGIVLKLFADTNHI